MENSGFVLEIWHIVVFFLALYLVIYFIAFQIFNKKLQKSENMIISQFLLKVSKIPGFIEALRPFVANEDNFELLTKLHSAAMIHKYETIYSLLEHNARINEQFAFLMKLGMQIPELKANTHLIYIRDFMLRYEEEMKKFFKQYNHNAEKFNKFVTIKNATIIGFLLPGKKKELI